MRAVGGVIGLALALGLLLAAARVHVARHPSMVSRIAPFVPSLRHRRAGPLGPGGLLLALAAAGSIRMPRPRAVHDPRSLLLHGVAGTLSGLVVGVTAVARGAGVLAPAVLGGIGAGCGVLLWERRSAAAASRRRVAIEAQLPVLVDLITLAVAAGESPLEALARVSRSADGPFAREVAVAVADVRAGAALEHALRDLSDRCHSPDVERFVEAVAIALDRGTPMVEVLREQAADVREAQRRRLMELAGRKEIAMLVPVVFLILPMVVVIALFPGFRALQVLVP